MKKIFVVGIGPGKKDCMTFEAAAALEKSEVIVGYSKYVELVRSYFPSAEFFQNGMTGEVSRCRHALELASSGRTVAVVCSGDSGVYGMAALVLELSVQFPSVEIEIVTGVTAALGGSALLGSPLTVDFCVISLSNILMSQEKIEKKLRSAASADFTIVLYNPMSKSRPDTLKKACDILLEILPPQTPCGWVRNIAREGEECRICTLGELGGENLDMFCTVFIGNSSMRIVEGGGRKWLVQPRGYGV
ncbi:MAG: precorrin-3B C(17)-methyltransferase [Treponema sp.]|nr:precorrin-3B C(17)-methyltransferase [Treponema sp.]